MSLVQALNLEPMRWGRASRAPDESQQAAFQKMLTMLGCPLNPLRNTKAGSMLGTHLEFRTTTDGKAYSWPEFLELFGVPYAATAWARSGLATRQEKHEALLRRLRKVVEKAKINQLLPTLRQSLADDDSVELILAFAFPNAADILPDVPCAYRDQALPHGDRVADSTVYAQTAPEEAMQSSSDGWASEGTSDAGTSSCDERACMCCKRVGEHPDMCTADTCDESCPSLHYCRSLSCGKLVCKNCEWPDRAYRNLITPDQEFLCCRCCSEACR